MKNKIFNIIVVLVFLIINVALFIYIYEDNIKDTLDSTLVTTVDGKLVSEDEVSKLEDSKIDGQSLNFDNDIYVYYKMLNTKEKKLYKQVFANANQLSTTFVPVDNYSLDEVKKVFECVFYDHPELFWLDTSYAYKYTKDGRVVQLIINFNYTKDNISYYKSQFDSAANKIILEAKKYKTNYEKEKFVHDKLISMTSYNKNEILNQSAYSVLINGQSVCAGYAKAFQYIMNQLGIKTYYVTGISNENHAWNIVYLDDGYYNVDLTWDDKNGISYKYFNKNDSDYSLSHKRTGLSLNLPTCNGKKYIYKEVVIDNKSNSNSNSNSNISIQKPIINDIPVEEDKTSNSNENISNENSNDNQDTIEQDTNNDNNNEE
jgi:hypothetical protein